jgi:hypothetical protein
MNTDHLGPIYTDWWKPNSPPRPCEVCGVRTGWRWRDQGPQHPDCALLAVGYDDVLVIIGGRLVERRP